MPVPSSGPATTPQPQALAVVQEPGRSDLGPVVLVLGLDLAGSSSLCLSSEVQLSHHYEETQPYLRNPGDRDVCKFYFAESAVAKESGMGIFTAVVRSLDELIVLIVVVVG